MIVYAVQVGAGCDHSVDSVWTTRESAEWRAAAIYGPCVPVAVREWTVDDPAVPGPTGYRLAGDINPTTGEADGELRGNKPWQFDRAGAKVTPDRDGSTRLTVVVASGGFPAAAERWEQERQRIAADLAASTDPPEDKNR